MDSLHKHRHALWQRYRNHSISLPFFISVAILFLLLAAPLIPLTSNISPLKSPVATAATSNQLNFQGRLLTATGGLVADGEYNVEFKLYYVATAGTAQWTETRLVSGTGVTIRNGYFSVYLGDQTAFPALDWSQDLYLGMNIGGTGAASWDGEMTPRFKLTSVPYAFKAANVASSSVDSADSDDVSITTGDSTTSGTTGDIIIDNGSGVTGNGGITLGATNASSILIGRTGVTTTNAGALTVTQLLTGNAGLTATGTITFSSLNCTGNANGGALTANGSGVISCSDDDGGAGGGSLFTQGTGFAYLTTTTDNLVVGSATNNGGKLEVLATTEQLRLSYDASNNTTFTVSSGGDLTVTPSGGQLSLAGDLEVTAGNYLSLAGGNTASRPGSPTEGMLYFDSDTDSLLTYANGKWQSDRGEFIVVAANDSTQAEKDSADYVADGTADQTEINNALTAAAGGKVILLAGTYVADGTILIPNNTTLAGTGPGTKIEFADIDPTSDNLIENSDTTTGTGVVIRDLKLDGRSDLNTVSAQTGVYFNGMGAGTTRDGGQVLNVVAYNFTDIAIQLNASDNNSFFGNTISNNSRGIYKSSSDNNSFFGNTIRNNTFAGVEIGGNNNIVSGNVIENNGGNGIEFNSGQYNVFSNNVISSNNYGYYNDCGGDYNRIQGNTINNNTFDGIYFDCGRGHIIDSNTLTGNGGSGIEIEYSDDNNIVSNNRVINSGGATANNGIVTDGADSIVGNTVTDSSCTTTCYAVYVYGSNAYLADNTYGVTAGTDQATINDTGTNTRYASQQVAGKTLQSGSTLLKAYGTQVLTGTIDPTASTTLTGVGTKFLTELQVGDRITVSAETRTVTAIASDTSLTVDTATTDTANDLTPDRLPAALIVKNSSGVNQLVVADNGAVTITNTLAVNTLGSADSDTVLCRNTSNQLATCNSTFVTSTTGFIQNGNSFTANAVLGTNDSYSLILETANTTALTIDTSQNSTFAGNLIVAATKSLRLVGGNTASRPAGVAGEIYYDTTQNEFLRFNGTKWISDRSDAIYVASSATSSQYDQDRADYLVDGESGDKLVTIDGDQVEINTALLAAAGAKVVILEGVYELDQPISIPNNTILSGVGPGTVIELADLDTTENAIENSDTVNGTGVIIRDLKLDGRDDLNTAGNQDGIIFNGMGAAAREGGQITNVIVQNFRRRGVDLVNSYKNVISESTFSGSNYGVRFSSGDNNTLSNSVIKDSAIYGVMLVNGDYNSVIGNTITTNDIGIEFDCSGADYALIDGNNINSNTADGIYFDCGDGISITNNTISSNGGNGIGVASSDSATIVSNNTFNNNSSGGIKWADYFIINNNIFTGGDSIYVSSNNVISNNRIDDPNGATENNGIVVNNNNNIITDNRVLDNSCTTTCYAIDISGSNNYLADNTYGVTAGTDQATTRDLGTNTRYANQQVAGKTLQSGSTLLKAYGTQVLTGTIDPTASTTLTGVGTKFLTELQVGDRITVSAETRTVTAIATDTSLTVDTAFSDNANDLTPDRLPAALVVSDSTGAAKVVVKDDGSLNVWQGTTVLGTSTQAGSLVVSDGSSNTVTLQASATAGNYTLSIPTLTGNDTICVLSGNCSGLGGLQASYNAGNTITTTNARDIDFTLANTATDSNFDIVIAASSTSAFRIYNDATLAVSYTTANGFSVPGAGGNTTQQLGYNAVASGGIQILAVGSGATATGDGSTAIGPSASAGIYGTSLGYGAVSGSGGISIGRNSTSVGGVTIGQAATGGSGNGVLAVGSNATATGDASTAIGGNSSATIYGTSIGFGSSASVGTGSIALGIYATATAGNQLVFGGNNYGINDVYIGEGVTNATPLAVKINATGGSGTDIAGANLTVAGGRGTGSGAGGSLILQTSPAGASGAGLNALTTYYTLNSAGLLRGSNGATISVPGTGSNSEAFGLNAIASGTDALAVGNGANASGSGNTTAIGQGSSASAGDATALGASASASGSDSIAIGTGSSVSGADGIVVGANSTGGYQGVLVGNDATIGGNNSVLIGHSASAAGQSVAIGQLAVATTRSVAIGQNSSANFAHSIAIGVNATATASNQLVIGGNSYQISDVYIGEGVTNATPLAVKINATGGSGTDIAGANLTVAGGRGTGTGTGGSLLFQTATAGASGASLNALTTRLTIDQAGASTFSGTLAVQGASTTIGTASTTNGGVVLLNATNAFGVTIQASGQLTGSATIQIPNTAGVGDTFCLVTIANCAGGGGANVNLSNITATNLSAALNVTSGNLNLTTTTSGNIVLNSAGTIELEDNTNVTGNADVSGTIFAGTGDAFQVATTGAVTAVGVNAGAGLLQGTLGLTVTGNTSLSTTAGNTTTIGNATGLLALTGSAGNIFNFNGVTIDDAELNVLDNGIELGDLITQGTATDEFCLTSETGGGALLAWQACGAGSSLFSQGTGFAYLTSTTDDFVLGATTVADGTFYVDVSTGSVRFGSIGTTDIAGSLVIADANGQTTTLSAGDSAGNLAFILPTTIGSSNQCIKNSGTAGTLTFANCNNGSGGGGAQTLQDTYTAGAAGDQIIALSTANDSIIFRNPASAGSDSAYILTLDQLSTGATGGLDIQSAGTGNLLRITDTTATARDVLIIADGGATTFRNQTNSTTAFVVQNATGTSVLNVNTSTVGITVTGTTTSTDLITAQGGLTVSTGSTFTNASSTLFTSVAVSDIAAGGDIGTAATKVDVATTFNVNQTTASQTLTLPSPTVTTAGRIAYVNNVGSVSFTMYSQVIASGDSATYIWNGTAWRPAYQDTTGGGGVTSLNSATGALTIANSSEAGGTITIDSAGSGTTGLTTAGAQTFGGAKTFNGGVIVAASQSLRLIGGNIASRPSLTTEAGTLYYDTETDQLLQWSETYDGSGVYKWKADRGEYFIVAANDSSDEEKASADFLADGTSDETEINLALTQAAGGKVLLLAGTYTADGTILIPNNTTLAGVGQGTIIQMDDIDTTDNLIENSDTTTGTGVVIRDLSLDGQEDLNTGATQHAIYLAGHGNTAAARPGGMFENLFIYDFDGSALYLTSTSENNTILNNYITNTIQTSIYVNSGNENTIEGNTIESTGGFQSSLALYTSDNIITNNISSNSTGSGFLIYTGSYNIIDGNKITNSANGYGIYLSGSTNNTVTNNEISNNGYDGIYLTNSSFNTLISGNNILDNTGDGIELFSEFGGENIITSNNIGGNETGIKVFFGGHDNLIGSNYIFNNGGTSANNGIVFNDGDRNSIIGNTITDNQCDTTCYAINIADAGSSNNYLEGNRYSDTDVTGGDDASINDVGTGTVYAGQATNTDTTTSNIVTNFTYRASNSTSFFELQRADGTEVLRADTTNNRLYVGDADNTSAANSTLFVVDSAGTANLPTGVNGGIVYDSTLNKFKIYEGGAYKILCNTTDLGCGAGGSFATTDLNNIASTNLSAALNVTSGNLALQTTTSGNITLTTAVAGGLVNILTGNLQVGNGTPTVSLDGEDAYIEGTLEVDGTAYFDGVLTVNGATVNSTLALTDFAAGGSIGSAASTVDIYSSISINQTTAAQTLTVATPTASTTYGRTVTINNIGSTPFTMLGTIVSPGNGIRIVWSNTTGGASWQVAGSARGNSTATITVATSASGGTSSAVASKTTAGADYVNTSTTSADVTINAALTAVGSAGGSVYLAEGTYIIDGSISIPNNVSLIGTGAGTIIKAKNGINANFSAIVNTDTTTGTNVTLRDFVLEGNKANQSGFVGMAGVDFNGMGNTTTRKGAIITNIQAKNWYYSFIDSNCYAGVGICLRNSSNNTLTSNTTNSNSSYGIYLITSSSFNTITGNTVNSNSSRGIYLTSSSNNNTLIGNTANNSNTFYGIELNSSSNNTLTSNTTNSNSSYGIFLNSSSSNTLTSNTANSNSSDGIFLIFSSSNTLTSNTVKSNSVNGINISSASSNNNITSNTLDSNSAKGINIFTSTNNNITGNNIAASGGTTVNDGIYLTASDYNSITNNNITDTACDTTCYAINISDIGSDNNYLEGNRYSDTDATGGDDASINDAGTGTVYAGQATNQDTTTSNIVTNFTYKASNSTSFFELQRADGTEVLRADTTNNRLYVGDADDTSGANTTLFVVDSASTANLPTGVNGGIVYDSTTGKFKIYEGGAYKTLCNTTDLGCGAGGSFATTDLNNIASTNLSAALNVTSGNLNLTTTTTGNIVLNSAGTIELQDATNVTGNLGVTGTLGVQTTNTSAVLFQSASAAETVLTVNTGTRSSGTAGNQLKVGNSTGSDTALTLFVLDTATADPTTNGGAIVGGAMYYDSTANKFRCYTTTWVDCDTTGGGGGTTVTKKFAPEFSNMVLNADGSNNSGTLTSGYDGTAYRNYYDWSTSQATAQDYDIVVQVQIPDDYTGSPANFRFWHKDPDGATTNANTTWSMIDDTGTSCFSTTFEGTTAGVWEQETATYSTCTLSANELVTFTFKVKTTTGAGNLQLGPFEFDYNN